ncbi:MAG: hypothetical protein AABX65_01630, partial [Nanoarchaeota archaeon]|mgnify:CR=1
MLWWKKNTEETKNSIPKLPELNPSFPKLPELSPSLPKFPNLPDFPEEHTEPAKIPSLPSFPNSSIAEKIGQVAVKQAVEDKEGEDEQRSFEIAPEETFREKRTREVSNEPVFIHIDKYETAFEHFQAMKKKLAEIEKTLDSLKETKAKEEAELVNWEKEMLLIKSRISDIQDKLFQKI